MDCQTALELLDIVRPDSGDLTEPELQSASAHVETCAKCESIFRGRQDLDRAIGKVVRDIAVPADLKSKLQDALAAATVEPDIEPVAGTPAVAANTAIDVEEPPKTQPAPAAKPLHRRAWFQVAATSACVALGVIVWLLPPEQSTIALNDLREQTIEKLSDVAALPAFDGGFAAGVPLDWKGLRTLRFAAFVHGLDSASSKTHLGAIHRFKLLRSGRGPVNGFLLAVPKSRVTTLPSAKSFAAAKVVYPKSRRFATAAWTDGGLVYICFVRGGAGEIEALQDAVKITLT